MLLKILPKNFRELIFTGYIGENCHFATFRKTCEELALLGYTRNDVYLIDIDGNGRFPPAHVKCEFQIEADSSTTVVEHNLPSQVVRFTNKCRPRLRPHEIVTLGSNICQA